MGVRTTVVLWWLRLLLLILELLSLLQSEDPLLVQKFTHIWRTCPNTVIFAHESHKFLVARFFLLQSFLLLLKLLSGLCCKLLSVLSLFLQDCEFFDHFHQLFHFCVVRLCCGTNIELKAMLFVIRLPFGLDLYLSNIFRLLVSYFRGPLAA